MKSKAARRCLAALRCVVSRRTAETRGQLPRGLCPSAARTWGNFRKKELKSELSDLVSVTHTASYEQEAVTAAVRTHFHRLGLGEKLRPGMQVLIKPNLLLKRRPEEGTTTHPALIAAIALCLRELGIEDIVIADSPGGPYAALSLGPIYEATGMRAAAQRSGARLNQDFGSFQRTAAGRLVQSFTLINPVRDADFIIDAAKLKTHGMTLLSGAVKNLFGTVPGLMKPEFHWRFPEREAFCGMLVDLCETVKPGAVFVDAITSMEGDGPSGGTLRDTGMLLASESPYAMDLALCRVIGAAPEQVDTVRISMERGLCSPEALTLAGDSLKTFSDYRMPRSRSLSFTEHIPKALRGAADRLLTTRPVVQSRRCLGCGKCAESCPAKTIRIDAGKARIDYSRCIRCFCCHEMCPFKAITLRRLKLFNW